MSKIDKLALIAVIVFLVSNPLLGQYILIGIDWVFQQIFIYGGYVCALAGAYIIFYIAYNMYRNSKVNIPPKSKKTKQQKYLPTKV